MKAIEDMVFMDVVSFAVSARGSNDMVHPFKKDEFGYLKGQAIIAAVGVQNYRTKDGKTLRVLRHPDDVFDEASMATMGMLPLVIRHPKKNFDPTTLQGKQVGSTGERILNDAYYLYAPITVTTAKAQQVIETGDMRELSIGYRAGLLMETGEWQGHKYDARQVNIRGNHLAIVKKARVGKAASFVMADGVDYEVDYEDCDAMLMDDIDTSLSFKDEKPKTKPNQEEGHKMAKFTLSTGQVVEADQAFIDSHSALLSENEVLKDSNTELEGKNSELSASVAAKDTELKDSADAEPTHEQVTSAAKELISVRETAVKAGVDFKDEDDVKTLKVATIKVVMPDAEFKDDSESDVKSFFNASKNLLAKKSTDKSVSNRKKMGGNGDVFDGDDNKKKPQAVTAASLEQSFHDGLYNAHIGEE